MRNRNFLLVLFNKILFNRTELPKQTMLDGNQLFYYCRKLAMWETCLKTTEVNLAIFHRIF